MSYWNGSWKAADFVNWVKINEQIKTRCNENILTVKPKSFFSVHSFCTFCANNKHKCIVLQMHIDMTHSQGTFTEICISNSVSF